MPDKVYSIALASEDYLAVVRFPGAGLRFAHDGEIGLSAGAKLQDDVARGGAVRALEPAGATRGGQEEQQT